MCDYTPRVHYTPTAREYHMHECVSSWMEKMSDEQGCVRYMGGIDDSLLFLRGGRTRRRARTIMVSVHLSSAERASKGEDRCACNVFHHREVAFHVVTVCDGHGGDRAACVCVDLLPRELKRAVVAGDGVEAACRRAFAAARDALCGEASGCAAAVVVLSSGRVTTGNVGDVEAVLVLLGSTAASRMPRFFCRPLIQERGAHGPGRRKRR